MSDMKAKHETEACELLRLKAATTRRVINGWRSAATRFREAKQTTYLIQTRFLQRELVKRRTETARLLRSLSMTHTHLASGASAAWHRRRFARQTYQRRQITCPLQRHHCPRVKSKPRRPTSCSWKIPYHSDTVHFIKARREAGEKLSSNSHGQNQKKKKKKKKSYFQQWLQQMEVWEGHQRSGKTLQS